MASTRRKVTRYENGPDTEEALQRACSSDPINLGIAPAISPLPSSKHRLHIHTVRLGIRPYSFSLLRTTERNHALSTEKISQTSTRRRGGSQSTELHQPIGFVCCHCRYHSSGSHCSNPDYAECPHKSIPRCSNCAIIFTKPRMTHRTCEGG
ncbi:hypothetical protein F5Y08DRAFT_323111 [Xylaria arbuscula]|nr:hypothetical protein F5Y08DRAFT_323111 [Xylaria arbuscula]